MNSEASIRNDRTGLAIFSILFAVLALSLGDAIIKSLSLGFSLWQIYVVRSVIALIILFPIIRLARKPGHLLPVSIGWTALRSLLLASMWVAYYAALSKVALSVAAAVLYTIPLFITLFSAWLTGDRVTPRSWLAIVTGFAGVVVIIRPDTDGLTVWVFLPLLAAMLYSLAMILTRTKCQHEDPAILSLSLNVMFVLMGLVATSLLFISGLDSTTKAANPFLLGDWIRPGYSGWLAMAILGVVIVIGSLFTAVAYQNAPSSVVASFDYSYLAFSAIWGLVFFSNLPDALTIFGILLITVAGIIAVRQ